MFQNQLLKQALMPIMPKLKTNFSCTQISASYYFLEKMRIASICKYSSALSYTAVRNATSQETLPDILLTNIYTKATSLYEL